MHLDSARWFRHSAPYINAHRGKTFVVMIPGSAVTDPNFVNIIYDIALLKSLGINLVLVQGARPQIDAELRSVGVTSQFYNRIRVTEFEHLPAVMSAIGKLRATMEASLSVGLPNSPMHGAQIRVVTGNFIIGRPWGVIDGVDFQFSGKVRRVDTQGLEGALAGGSIVLLFPLSTSRTGELFNLSFGDIAVSVAVALKAEKLIALTAEKGFCDAAGALQRDLTIQECEGAIRSYEENGEHSQSLSACLEVCRNGVPRAHMVSYRNDGALLEELFTREGSGTLVHADTYEVVRSATVRDVSGIVDLISPLERSGALVRRSRDLLEREIDQFIVLEKEGVLVACAALNPYSATAAELVCVATHPEYQGGGRAATVVGHIEEKARAMGIRELFLLTTQATHWFQEQGFVPVGVEQLPEVKRGQYNYQRNSKVLCKVL